MGKFKSTEQFAEGINDLTRIVPTWVELRNVENKGWVLARINSNIQLPQIKEIIDRYYHLEQYAENKENWQIKVKCKRTFKEFQ